MVDLQRAVTCAVRPWGWFSVVAGDDEELIVAVRTLVLEPGQALSLQVHRHRRERWFPLTHGLGAVIGDESCELHPGHTYEIGAGVAHRLLDLAGVGGTVVQLLFSHDDANDVAHEESSRQEARPRP